MQQWSEDGVRQERTGWRCEKISERHRIWGYNCPAVDLDFMVAEYNHGKPVALIEYKDRHAGKPKIDHPTYRALCALANGYKDGPLPFMIVFYDSENWWFEVLPMNQVAVEWYSHVNGEKITEQRFVTSLYKLRKKTLSAEDEKAISQLNNILPEE